MEISYLYHLQINTDFSAKNRINKFCDFLIDLSITSGRSGCVVVLSFLVALSGSSLYGLDTEANVFYDKAHILYDAVRLTRSNTQGALHNYINLEVNNKGHLTYHCLTLQYLSKFLFHFLCVL